MKADLGERVVYASRRTHRGARAGELSVSYEPTGEVFRSVKGSLENWLSERYCLYASDGKGSLWRGDVQHEPWPLQPAKAVIHKNTLGDLPGVSLEGEPDSILFSRRIDVLGWALEACA